jgi:hypothetical protein
LVEPKEPTTKNSKQYSVGGGSGQDERTMVEDDMPIEGRPRTGSKFTLDESDVVDPSTGSLLPTGAPD